MEPFDVAQHALRRVRLLPDPGGVLVRLGEGRVDVDGAEDLVEADAVLHRRDELHDQLAGVLADDGRAQDPVLARHGQHFHHAVRLLVGDGAVQIVEAVGGELVGDAALLRLRLVQADARHFRIGERGPRDDRIVGAEFLQPAEERVHRRVPGLVRRRVRELVGPGDVAAGIDVRIHGLQVRVGLDGARLRHRDAQLFQPVARRVRHAPHRAEQIVELDATLAAAAFTDQEFLFAVHHDLRRLVPGQDVDALLAESLRHHRGNLGILADQDARQHLDLAQLRAEAREYLRELAADRAAAQHHQPPRQHADIPHRVRGQRLDLLDPGNRRHERPRPRRDDDCAGAKSLRFFFRPYLYGPGRRNPRLSFNAFHPQTRVALGRVVWLYGFNDALDPLHDIREVKLCCRPSYPVFG